MPDPSLERVIDARAMMPPEPFEVTMAALDDLPPGGEIVLLLYREPFPLYKVLKTNGFTHSVHLAQDGTVEIRIRHAAPPA